MLGSCLSCTLSGSRKDTLRQHYPCWAVNQPNTVDTPASLPWWNTATVRNTRLHAESWHNSALRRFPPVSVTVPHGTTSSCTSAGLLSSSTTQLYMQVLLYDTLTMYESVEILNVNLELHTLDTVTLTASVHTCYHQGSRLGLTPGVDTLTPGVDTRRWRDDIRCWHVDIR